jgi:hypothetical protein
MQKAPSDLWAVCLAIDDGGEVRNEWFVVRGEAEDAATWATVEAHREGWIVRGVEHIGKVIDWSEHDPNK